MRWTWWWWAAVACGPKPVAALDLHDARLPVEARRWLADAEDDVAIASARVDEASAAVTAMTRERDALVLRLDRMARAGPADGVRGALLAYSGERIALAALGLDAARSSLALSSARLVQARAEAAMRYDLAVYELEPLEQEVQSRTAAVAAAERAEEERRAAVETSAAAAWAAFASFVQAGGRSEALWTTEPEREAR